MSGYFSSPPPKLGPPAPTPKGGGISPANTKLLAQGRGPLKAPAKAAGGRVTPTVRVAKAPAGPKNFTQAAALEKQVRARVQAQFPKLPGFAIDHIVKLQLAKGPRADVGSQFNPADLAAAAQIGVRPTGAGAALNTVGAVVNAGARGLVHPATDLAHGPSSVTGALSDVGNLALNLVTPEKAGLAAGLFGAKGLRDAKTGEDAYQAAKDAKTAKIAADVPTAPRIIPVVRDEVSNYSRADIPLEENAQLLPKGPYLYHSTDVASFPAIAKEGLKPGKVRPGEVHGVFLGQDSYDIHGLRPGNKRSGDVYLRVARDKVNTEVTDMYKPGSGFEEHVSRAPIPAQHLEYLGADNQWHPVQSFASKGNVADTASPEAKAATAQLREGLKGSRSVYGKEKVLKSEETARRAQEVAKIHATVKDPQEAMAQVSAVLRGKYPTVEYNGLKELTPETVKQLQTIVQAHPRLPELSKHNTMKAIQAAAEGRNPRPHELRMIETVFGPKTAASFVSQAQQGLWHKIVNVANIPRSMQTFLDVSGLMRQNLVAGASHPAIFARNLPKAFQGMKGANFERFAQTIKDDPDYPMALQAGIQFTDIGEHASLAAHEEGFQSDYATRIPVVGRAIKMSARSYVTTGNEMKMGLFKNRLRLAQAAGQNITDEKTLSQIGQVINAATGRGTAPEPLEHLLPAMNTFLFSPRLMLSRLHYFDPTWYVRLKGPARREALRGLFATAGGVTTALYLFSRIPGVEVGSLDPTSADFGKLKVGNTRIDIAGGFQQYIHLAAELYEKAETSSTTGKKTTLGSGFGIPTRLDVLENFGINKLSPPFGLGANVLRGHDAIGGPSTLPGQGKKTLGIPFGTIPPNYFVPLVIQDAKDIYREKHGGINGLAWALGGYGLDATGISEQTYGPKPPSAASSSGSSSYFGGPSSSGGSDYFGSP